MTTGTKGKTYVITADHLTRLKWVHVNDAMLKDLHACQDKFSITTKQRVRHFISQCMHESAKGVYTKEIADGSAYNNRDDLGNTHPGDGPKYKGAGYIQLTGRKNYEAFAKAIGDAKVMDGVDYVSQKYPWMSAGFWWWSNKMNELCDQEGVSVREVTRRVNGGTNGLKERETYYEDCVKVFL